MAGPSAPPKAKWKYCLIAEGYYNLCSCHQCRSLLVPAPTKNALQHDLSTYSTCDD